jgi:hypothetical protein
VLDYVIVSAVGMIGVGVASCVVANRPDVRSSTEATAAHRRPRGCPPDPVLRLALETVGTHGLGLSRTRTDIQADVRSNSALESRRTA